MRIGYATYTEDENDPDPDLDWPLVQRAAQLRNVEISAHDWRDSCDWGAFDVVLVRSTWDYSSRLEEFLSWARLVNSQTLLLNDLETIIANTNKRYLAKLGEAGASVIPTIYIPQTALADDSSTLELESKVDAWLARAGRVAVKPTVGAGARLAIAASDRYQVLDQVRAIHQAGKEAMVQPYQSTVDTEGEVAVVLIGGRVTHAVKKRPALTEGGHGDGLERVEITQDLLNFCTSIASAATAAQVTSNWSDLTYARIDAVPSSTAPLGWQLMELELTEPALFLDKHPDAAQDLIDLVIEKVTLTNKLGGSRT